VLLEMSWQHKEKAPCPINQAQLKELVKVHGTPLQLYDEAAIRSNLHDFLSAFKEHFPGFQNFYAVKALPNPAILQVVLDAGCGLDCSSTSELYIAKELGVAPEQVMYTSNYTSPTDLKKAFEQGVIMNLDDVTLVDSLVKECKKCPELISFRYNPGLGNTDSETKSNVLGGPEAKFGVPEEQILEAYRKAKENGATRFGIHMMTGSCVMGDDYWAETVSLILAQMAFLRKELDIEFEFVNIGGGIGMPYKPDEPRVNYAQLAKCVRKVFTEKLQEHGIEKEPKLLMECGRCVTGPYGWLVAQCDVVKKSFGNTYFGLDACMANLMRPGMYDSYHHITVAGRTAETGDLARSNVVGTLCENNDWFAKDRMLPKDCDVGDLFVIHDTGAHSHSMGFQYNGKLRAPEILLRSSSTAEKPVYNLIRTRETIKGLYDNTLQLPDVKEYSAASLQYTSAQNRGGISKADSFVRSYWGVAAIIAASVAINVAVGYKRKN